MAALDTWANGSFHSISLPHDEVLTYPSNILHKAIYLSLPNPAPPRLSRSESSSGSRVFGRGDHISGFFDAESEDARTEEALCVIEVVCRQLVISLKIFTFNAPPAQVQLSFIPSLYQCLYHLLKYCECHVECSPLT